MQAQPAGEKRPTEPASSQTAFGCGEPPCLIQSIDYPAQIAGLRSRPPCRQINENTCKVRTHDFTRMLCMTSWAKAAKSSRGTRPLCKRGVRQLADIRLGQQGRRDRTLRAYRTTWGWPAPTPADSLSVETVSFSATRKFPCSSSKEQRTAGRSPTHIETFHTGSRLKTEDKLTPLHVDQDACAYRVAQTCPFYVTTA